MGQLIAGKWSEGWFSNQQKGKFERSTTTFRNTITKDSVDFPVESGRYHLYISHACPWAHRTLLVRHLLGLQPHISISIVAPRMDNQGWSFEGQDEILGKTRLYEIYTESNPQYTGRVTVPVLWDKKQHTIVNNESREIMRMFNTQLAPLGESQYPALWTSNLSDPIDTMIDANYETINNGVYKCGFATTQQAYDDAYQALFTRLDELDALLENSRYLLGERLTEADICLFTTLFRFDSVYYSHFKCNRQRLIDFANLHNYILDIYQTADIASQCHMQQIKDHYFFSHTTLNPSQIIPNGPQINWSAEHGRE